MSAQTSGERHSLSQFRLFCLINGQESLIPISIYKDQDTGFLRHLIWERGIHQPSNILAKDLNLFKVNMHVPDASPEDFRKLTESRLEQLALTEKGQDSTHMNVLKPVSDSWGEPPARDTLHVFVTINANKRKGPELQAADCKRLKLNEGLSEPANARGYGMDVSDKATDNGRRNSLPRITLDDAIELAKALLERNNPSIKLAATTDAEVDYSNEFFVDGLGVLCDLDPAMRRRADDLFKPGKSKVIFNTSGSGKTRLLVEGLCLYWGFYFTTEDEPSLGSRDIYQSIVAVPSVEAFVQHPPGSSRATLERNQHIARIACSSVLLARLLVLEAFLKAGNGIPPMELRRRWTYLQLVPSVLRSQFSSPEADIFVALYEVFGNLEGNDHLLVYAQIKQCCRDYHRKICQNSQVSGSSLVMVLDQAQVLSDMYPDALYSDSDTSFGGPRSVLRELCITLRPDPMNSVILSGTGFSLTEVSISMANSLGVTGNVFKDLGAFVRQEDQEAYITRHVTLEEYTRKEVLNRAWRWLRGRHRFTAGFVHALRCCGTENASALLTHYVYLLTGYIPLDGTIQALTLEQRDNFPRFKPLSLQLNKLDHHKVLRGRVSDAVVNFMLSHKPPLFESRDVTAIELGVARYMTTSECVYTSQSIVIDEPLIIATTLDYLDRDVESMEEKIRGRICNLPTGPTRGYAFEVLGMYVLAKLLDGTKSLREIFEFQTDSVDIGNGKAQLIAIHAMEPLRYSIVDEPWRYPLGLGFEASNPSEHARWFKGIGVPFCFPDPRSGHDIGFFVLVDNKFVFVMDQLESYGTDLNDVTTEGALDLRSLLLGESYMDNNGKIYTPAKSTRRLMHNLIKNHDVPCLGVLTSFSSQPHSQAMKEKASEYFAFFGLLKAKGNLGDMLRTYKIDQSSNSSNYSLEKWSTKD